MKLFALALRVVDTVGRELTYYLHVADGVRGVSFWRLDLAEAWPFDGREVMRALEAAIDCLDELTLELGRQQLAMCWIAPLPLVGADA